MNVVRNAILAAVCLVAGTAWAQDVHVPLNLQLPPSDLPATASSTASDSTASATHTANGNPTSPPGVYYGDTSGRTSSAGDDRVAVQRCDDFTYNQPQVHGSASLGVMGGDHVSGNYQAATIQVTRNLGDCEHPTGRVGFSINVSQGRFHGRGW